MIWSEEVRSRLERIPILFLREKVKKGVEAYAQAKTIRLITTGVMKEALPGTGRPKAFGKMPSFRSPKKNQ